jgi:glycosyltransferase involved in cell wall biosynthesis
MTVSVALIVKDEEPVLGRALESIAGAVDEIVVVDTGSRDATKAVAERHGARVADFPWRDDFSAARQYAFDQATGQWVFWLDADDVVIGAERIRAIAADAPPEVGGFYWRYILARNDRHEPTYSCWRERCVRNDGSFRWRGRVHEVLVPAGPVLLVNTDEIVVEHRPRTDRPDQRSRNLRILEEEVEAGGESPEPRLLYYLGREYADHGDIPRAIETLERYVAVSRWDDERYFAYVQTADLGVATGDYARALEACWAALEIQPRWPDAYFGLARIYYFRREWEKVVHWAQIGQSLPPPETMLFVNTAAYQFDWIIYYTNALYHLGRKTEALSWTVRALAIAPHDTWHRHNLRLLTAPPTD